MDDVLAGPAGGCPFINRNEQRCGTRFGLGRIDQAFTVCFGAFQACPMFQQIRKERDAEERAVAAAERPLPIVTLTVSAHGSRRLGSTGS